MKGDPPKGKLSKNMKNCRRWRRRSSNVTKEFRAKKGWLETHLWHAKRCKMIEYWGYKIAAHLNEKCHKSTYRASVHGALLHDFSYWTPFWMDSCNVEKIQLSFGFSPVLDITIEHESIQLCPVKIFIQTFEKPVMFLHPAAVETGILEHVSFETFLNDFGISLLSSAFDELCTFKIQGSKTESVLCQFLNIPKIEEYPLRLSIKDPRTTKEQSSHLLTLEQLSNLIKIGVCPTDDEVNQTKSRLFIPSSVEDEGTPPIPIAISKSSKLEYYLNCPRNWARVIWNFLNKIKHVKIAGIEQVDMISFENDIPIFPTDFVRSPAYEIWSRREADRLETIYKRKPPAKRPSFTKFGIDSPFRPNFGQFGQNVLQKAVVEIEGKGVITDFAEIYTIEKMLIGFATSSSKASLKKGRSTAIVSLTTTAISHVLVRNLCSPAIFRTGKISSFISDK